MGADFARLKKAAVRATGGGGPEDAEEFIWGVVEAAMAGVGGSAVVTLQLVKFLREYGSADKTDYSDNLIPNPYFVVNGHGGRSRITNSYLVNRKLKSFGSTTVGVGSAALSTVTLVDVGGTIQHGNALGTSLKHWEQLAALSNRYKQSRTLTAWLDACIWAKQLKCMVRTANFASSVIPVPASQVVTGTVSALAKAGIKLTYGKLVARTAMELHWRARVEATLGAHFGGGKRGAQGPAGTMIHELFTRRGMTRVFGKYDTDGIIREPAGWIALNDKLMMM